MTTLTTLNRQRGVLKTKVNKITKFINEYECTQLIGSQEEQQEERLHLKGKKVSILEIKTSLRNLIVSYTTLPEDVDIADSLEVATELEDELKSKAHFNVCPLALNNKNLW